MPTIHYHNLKPKAKSSFTVRRLIGLRDRKSVGRERVC